MMEKSKKTAIKIELIISTIFMIVMNWFLYNRSLTIAEDIELYFFVSIAIFFNGLYIVHFILSVKSKDKTALPVESLMIVMDDMEYALPTNVEYSEQYQTDDKIDENKDIIEQQDRAHIQDIQKEIEQPLTYADIPKPKRVIPQEAIFDKTIEPEKYCDQLSQYFYDRGLFVEKNNLREIFASLAASKLIILKHESPIISQRFMELFSEYLGAHYVIDEGMEHVETFDELFVGEHPLKSSLMSANKHQHKMHIMTFKDVNLNQFEQYGKIFIDFAINPLLPCYINSREFKNKFKMPMNMWYVIIPHAKEDMHLSEKISEAAVTLEITAKIIEPKEEVYENHIKVTFESFRNLLIDGFEQYFIDEQVWKNIDEVEAFFNQYKPFSIDNRLFRQLERYTSTFLMFGGEKNEAVDHMFYNKLLHVLSTIDLSKPQENREDVLLLFEKLFGLENLIKSKNVIKEIQERNQALESN